MSAVTIILILLVVLLVAGLPNWYRTSPYAGFGYYPSGVIAILLVVLLVLLLAGVIR